MGTWSKILSYLTFKKQEAPTEKGTNFNLRAMHTINKISLFMFVGAIIYLFIKWVIL